MKRALAGRAADRFAKDAKPHWLRAIAGFAASVTVMTILAVAVVSLLDRREMREGRSASLTHAADRQTSVDKF